MNVKYHDQSELDIGGRETCHFMYCLKFPFSVAENIVPLSGNLSEILNFLYPADLSYKTD